MRFRLTTAALVAALILQAASPCVALCAMPRQDGKAATATTEVPACHKHAASVSDRSFTSDVALKAPLPACCCVSDAGSNSPREASTEVFMSGSSPPLSVSALATLVLPAPLNIAAH